MERKSELEEKKRKILKYKLMRASGVSVGLQLQSPDAHCMNSIAHIINEKVKHKIQKKNLGKQEITQNKHFKT